MSIEAKALDLYHRVTLRLDNLDSRQIFQKIANAEKAYLESLDKLLDTLKGTD